MTTAVGARCAVSVRLARPSTLGNGYRPSTLRAETVSAPTAGVLDRSSSMAGRHRTTSLILRGCRDEAGTSSPVDMCGKNAGAIRTDRGGTHSRGVAPVVQIDRPPVILA